MKQQTLAMAADAQSGFEHHRKPTRRDEFLKTMDVLSEKYGKPLAQIAINWSTQKSFVSTALTGVRKVSEAQENCAAFEWSLSDEDIALLDAELTRLLDDQRCRRDGGRCEDDVRVRCLDVREHCLKIGLVRLELLLVDDGSAELLKCGLEEGA